MRVYLSDEEYDNIKNSSKRAKLSISTFARKVCLGSEVVSREDVEARRDLYRVHADLGRLGGLFKLALSEKVSPDEVRPLLREIERRQLELKEVVKRI